MDWMQTLSIILTVLGTGFYIHRDIRSFMKTQSARTDRLYDMWCENQKEMNEVRKELNEKWNDLKKDLDKKWSDLLIKYAEKK